MLPPSVHAVLLTDCAPPPRLPPSPPRSPPPVPNAHNRLMVMVAAAPNATSLSLLGGMPYAMVPATAEAAAAAVPCLRRLSMDAWAAQSVATKAWAAFMRSAAGRLVSLTAPDVGRWGEAERAALAGCSALTELSIGMGCMRRSRG